MQIPLVDLRAQYSTIKSEIDSAVQRVLDNTSFIMGKEVTSFEAAFASFVGATGAAGVASGTAALHLALLGQVEDRITDRTRAIMPVHLMANPATSTL